MNRLARFAMELLLPPFLVASPFLVFALLVGEPVASLFILQFAYLLGGVPSIAFAVILELAFMAGLDPLGEGFVRLASWLGLLAGLGMAAIGSGPRLGDRFATFILLSALGVAGGAFTALLVRWWSRRPA